MKPKIGVFSFTSCEGCQLTILNLEDEILALLGHLDIVNFREAIDEKRDDYDIAFVEGSITTPADEEEVKEIRQHAKLVVALGACACIGGVNGMKNRHDLEETRRYVYGEGARHFPTTPTRRVRDVVPVDYEMHGCPIDKKEFLRVASTLLLGQSPRVPNDAICNECKALGNVCMYDKGDYCLGPVTREGCGALCPTYGEVCMGCRGFVDHANLEGMVEAMKAHGMARRDIELRLTQFNALTPVDVGRFFPN